MAQIAKNDADKATDAAKDTAGNVTRIAKEGADKAADTTREVAEKTRDVAGRVAARTASVADDATQRSTQMLRRSTELGTRAMSGLFQADGEFARAWLDLAGEQVTHNIETMRKLAATRDWREALALQHAFTRDSVARLNEGMSRSMGLSGKAMARLLTAGRGETDSRVA
jgi:hypothetical protein